MIIKTTIRLTYNNKFIETSALKDGSQAVNAINAINPFDSTGIISAVQLNPFDGTGIVYSHQATAVGSSVSADQATDTINSVPDDNDNVSDDQATDTINSVPDDNDNVSDDQATDAINSVAVPDDNDNVSDDQATAVGSSVSADQLKNEGQQNFQDGTGAYIHVDQTFDKVGLIKGYTRTITFPSAIFKPTDPKNIKQIKVN